MNLPQVHIIVLNYNNFAETEKCIRSLQSVTYPSIRIIIVDNASTDSSVQQFMMHFKDCKLIHSPFNKGYAGGMNLGIKYALNEGADIIMLSNNDMIYPPEFLSSLVNALLGNDSIGIVSPKVLYLNSENIIYCAGGEAKLYRCGGVSMYRNKNAKNYGNTEREISMAEGSCLLVKKKVFTEVGLLDERFFMYFEDIEFSRRVIEKFVIKYIPDSVVFHKSGAGRKWAEFSSLYYYYFTRNRLLYYSTHNYFIRIYVMIFSFLNVISKSIILFIKFILQPSVFDQLKKSFVSLWHGFFDGIKYSLGIIQPADDCPILRKQD
jgi:GT2 family glycosyltransferase